MKQNPITHPSDGERPTDIAHGREHSLRPNTRQPGVPETPYQSSGIQDLKEALDEERAKGPITY